AAAAAAKDPCRSSASKISSASRFNLMFSPVYKKTQQVGKNSAVSLKSPSAYHGFYRRYTHQMFNRNITGKVNYVQVSTA
ncbi:hypothetical protein KFY51_26205, partial [Salmonella enterica subsp. enterica serovar 1,4,[5],12:i:-]|nr:hypothetical protein [Salmonella enterica subsp. enterica serovar 1,4,[5],12:i:-]